MGDTELLKRFEDHRIVSYISDPQNNLEGFIAIHRGSLNNPAFGATRIMPYGSKEEALEDALRLSKLMSYKSALAGLKYGGGKGVIISPQKRLNKKRLLDAYLEKVNYFNGHFITGADVGISQSDVKTMREISPFVVGVRSNPVKYTALGMECALEVALEEVFGSDKISGHSFAIQGMGKIGEGFLSRIYKKASKIFVTDIDLEALQAVKRKFPKVEIVSPPAIYRQKADVFSPCAVSNALTAKTITKIRAPIILGGANNQLENSTVGELLNKIGIMYAPDYVVNAGGLISVVDEYEHKRLDEARIFRRLTNVKTVLKTVFGQSKITGRATNLVADEMAERIFNNE